jgi:RNA polymerase sigma factor FliA
MTIAEAYGPAARAPVNLDAVVRQHAELVKRIAYYLAGRLPPQVEVDDLVQAGMIGLIEAAQNYTAGRGASFETYAGFRIRGAMLDALRRLDWAPRSVHRKARAAAAALRAVEADKGAAATEAEVAARMGVSIDDYNKILRDALGCQVLHLSDGDEDSDSPLDRVADDGPDPAGSLFDDRMRKAVIEAIERLPERERMVLSLYYGDELNLKEIGAVMKVTESRVCQLHGQALVRLRARLAEWSERE